MSDRAGMRAAWFVAATFVLAACGGTRDAVTASGAVYPLLPQQRSALTGSGGKITHVVIIIQENRSFDNLFQGYPGANTVPSGQNSMGQTIALAPVTLATQYDLDHSATGFIEACDGSPPGQNCKNDGFDLEQVQGLDKPKYPQYVYVPHDETKPLFDIAHEFVVADNTFTSQIDESFVSHQYFIAAQASSAVNLPEGYWGCDGGPSDKVLTLNPDRTYGPRERACFDNQTLGDELDGAGLTWRFYAGKLRGDGGYWSGYQAIRHIIDGPDWKNIISPQRRFFTDIVHGRLANVTWITPICKNSDHLNCDGKTGPDWVTALVNAIGESQFWSSTAVFVMWDDWGGLYDHVPPPYKDYDGLGFRVPLLVVSPYAKRNYVSHVQYETGSILRFAEDQFGLGQLAASDARATSPQADAFDFTKPPRRFVPIKDGLGPAFFMQQAPDDRQPDY
jgi:phospholipase C